MNVLIPGILLFAVALLLHLVVWRLWRPRGPIKTLVLLFGAVALLGTIFLIFYSSYTILQHLQIVTLFFLLFACYLLTYSAIDADSPSLVIVSRILQAGKNGMVYESLKESLGDNLLVDPRLKDLVESRLVDLAGSIYKINGKGKLFAMSFIAYRNFLGLNKGG